MSELAQILEQAQSHDHQIRTAAEANLKQAEETQPGPYMQALLGELSSEDRPMNSRQLAGLQLKNLFKVRVPAHGRGLDGERHPTPPCSSSHSSDASISLGLVCTSALRLPPPPSLAYLLVSLLHRRRTKDCKI